MELFYSMHEFRQLKRSKFTMTICSICLEHLEQPVCCIPCGHLYCNQCISDWRNRHNNRCPECRKQFTTVQSIYLDTESIKGQLSKLNSFFIQVHVIDAKFSMLCFVDRCLSFVQFFLCFNLFWLFFTCVFCPVYLFLLSLFYIRVITRAFSRLCPIFPRASSPKLFNNKTSTFLK